MHVPAPVPSPDHSSQASYQIAKAWREQLKRNVQGALIAFVRPLLFYLLPCDTTGYCDLLCCLLLHPLQLSLSLSPSLSSLNDLPQVGTKKDRTAKRKVTTEEAKEYCEKEGVQLFLETSAETGENVNEVFSEIARMLAA
jgi:GTPase SAR1 family protein